MTTLLNQRGEQTQEELDQVKVFCVFSTKCHHKSHKTCAVCLDYLRWEARGNDQKKVTV